MSFTNIKLNPSLYDRSIQGIEMANRNLVPTTEKPELTGNMPSMRQTVLTFQKISNTITKCNSMIDKLNRNLKSTGEIIIKQDQSVAGTK